HILAMIGVGTMPIYIFHLGVRHLIKFDGLYIGAVVVGLLFLGALVSWLYAKVQHKAVWALYGVVVAGGIALFASGILAPLFNLVPENKIAFYVLVYGSGTLCALSFLAPVYKKIYNFVVDGPLWATEKLKRWLAFEKEPEQVA
ncbi:MAG: hypothetical protein IJV62_04965, partial [Eggerthellaceae bacterium]|nr:hypothetical protein [Eggerthellaceae bacterium]